MKVLLVDPWGVNNLGDYLRGLIAGIAPLTELTVVTNCYFKGENTNFKLFKKFFPYSQNMDNGSVRKLIRGLEYIATWLWIIRLARKEKYDVIHIDWLLLYGLDKYFIKALRRYCGKIVYTVHDALPHVDGEKSIGVLRKIYNKCNVCIVHGKGIKNELVTLYSYPESRIYIQKHGAILGDVPVVDTMVIPEKDKKRLSSFSKKILFLGLIFPNKGTDRLLKLWHEEFQNSDMALIVAGKKRAVYPEFDIYREKVKSQENVFLYDYSVPEELLNALIVESDLIVLPYRHASMSGVVFTAAQFSKPVLCTDVGALAEYLGDGVDSFVCENSTAAIKEKLLLIEDMDRKILSDMGNKLHEHITKKCNWLEIGKGIVEEVYSIN